MVLDEEKAAAKAKKNEEKTAIRIEKESEKSRRAEEKRLERESKVNTAEVRKEDAGAATTNTEPAITATTSASTSGNAEPTDLASVETPRTPPEQTEPSLERLESPIPIRSPGGLDTSLHPALERHVSNIGTSDSDMSEDEDIAHVATTDSVATTTEPEVAVVAVVAQPITVESASAAKSTKPETEQETTPLAKTSKTDRESKGRFSGIFGKLRRKSIKEQSQPGKLSSVNADKPALTSATVDPTSASAQDITAEEVIASTSGVSDAGRASPSSFRRHEEDLHSISSVSSDDADATRGRNKSRISLSSDDDDADEFEEARDHFDESLAPPPSFGGQAKSASPVRETKFQEEL